MSKANMDKIKSIQEAIHELKCGRDNRVRSITKAGIASFRGDEGYLVSAINELWDLVTDVAIRRAEERLKSVATEEKERAEQILRSK